jgi:hypothetical protein
LLQAIGRLEISSVQPATQSGIRLASALGMRDIKRARVTMLACWAFLVLPIWVGAQATSTYQEIDTPQGKMVVFDGKKHPETIPAYVAWREGFQTLDLGKRHGSRAIPQELGLSEADFRDVYAEARVQVRRLTECRERQQKEQTALKQAGHDWKAIYEAIQAIEYGCRVEVIEGRDRLLAGLSPEGAIALTTWIDTGRQAIKVFVPADEVESFKRPQ